MGERSVNKKQNLEIIKDKILQVITIKDVLHQEGVKVRGRRCRCLIHGGDNNTTFGFTDVTFNCFKCGATGNLIDLVMQIHSLRFEEALKKICFDFALPFSFELEATEEEKRKWLEMKRQRELAKQIEKDNNKAYLELVNHRLRLWEQGKPTEFVDRVLDEEPKEIMKYLEIKEYGREF